MAQTTCGGGAPESPLKEGEADRAEEVTPAGGQVHVAGLGAVVHHAEEHQELRPRAVPVVHGVGVEASVLAQAFEEPDDRVVTDEGGIVREQPAFFRIEQEYQAQDDGKEGTVDVVGILFELAGQQCAVRLLVRRLETPQQLVETVQHLLRQALAHNVLILAAGLKETREAVIPRPRQEPGLAEQQSQGRAERAPHYGTHVGDPEVQPAGAFAARGGDEPNHGPVEEDAGGHTRGPQQAFEPTVRRRLQALPPPHNPVEVGALSDDLDQQLPG